MTRIKHHPDTCTCRKCLGQRYGEWLDDAGSHTISGCWNCFATITFATPNYPFMRGFKTTRSRPSPEFAQHFFRFFVAHFEVVLGERMDYAVTDEYGAQSGRFHMHALLAAPSLPNVRLHVESWLSKQAGYSRVLPFERGASFYISKFMGHGSQSCEWDLRIGDNCMDHVRKPEKWGEVVVVSADLPWYAFHQGFPGRHR